MVSFLVYSTAVAQTHNSFYQQLVNQVNASNLTAKLTQFADFGVKEMGTSEQNDAFLWIKNLYESWGYVVEQQEVTVWGATGYNLIVTKQGTLYPNTYIVIDAHYDTINGPGANDNGSGTVILLEMARILKDIPTEYSIKFIHFTGEEWGLHGSEAYVQEIALPQNLDIKLVFNIDQVGGVAGEINDTITCERDESSPNSNNNASHIATAELANLMTLYSNLNTTISYAYASDYMPFQDEGFVITGLYEFNESPFTHSPQDVIANLDLNFILEVAKGTMGALCYFAKAYDNMRLDEQIDNRFQISPNPVHNLLTIRSSIDGQKEIRLLSLDGALVLSMPFFANEISMDLSKIPNGHYILYLKTNNVQSTQKLIVQHK